MVLFPRFESKDKKEKSIEIIISIRAKKQYPPTF